MSKMSFKKLPDPGQKKPVGKSNENNKGEMVSYYYFTPAEVKVKDLSRAIRTVSPDHVEIWTELNIMEVVLEKDSLVFQDATQVFEDPADLAFLKENDIHSLWYIDYNSLDEAAVFQVLKELLTAFGGLVASDTDNFRPSFCLSAEGTMKKIL